MRRGGGPPLSFGHFPLLRSYLGGGNPASQTAPLDSRLRGKDGGLRGVNPRTPGIPCGRFASPSLRERDGRPRGSPLRFELADGRPRGSPLRFELADGRPRGSPLRFELAAFYEVVEEVGVGYANGDILPGVSWRLIRFHAARSSFSWMEAHSMTRP